MGGVRRRKATRTALCKYPELRLGARGGEEIAEHPWFQRFVDLESIQLDTLAPPFAPGKDIHAHSQTSIGVFTEDLSKIHLTEEDDEALRTWNFRSNTAFNKEIIGVLKDEETRGKAGGGGSGGGGHGGGRGRSMCSVT